MATKAREYASLIINGKDYHDWTDVQVVVNYNDKPYRQFVFTCTEADPKASWWSDLQIKPGDDCQIKLAGELAFTGYVNQRSASYNDSMHAVQIAGRSMLQELVDSSAPIQNGGGYDNMTWTQIAKRLLKPHGIKLVTQGFGDAQNIPFKHVQTQFGESPFNLLDRIGRNLGIRMLDQATGELLAVGGDSKLTSNEQLTEGKNILIGRCTIVDDSYNSTTSAVSHYPGNDKVWGKKANQKSVTMTDPSGNRYRPYIFVAEEPAEKMGDLMTRTAFEIKWKASVRVVAEITVYGWQKSNGELWKTGEAVMINSPMLLLNMVPLYVKSIIFSQNNSTGTRTMLTLVHQLAPHLAAGDPADASKPTKDATATVAIPLPKARPDPLPAKKLPVDDSPPSGFPNDAGAGDGGGGGGGGGF